MLNYFHSEKSFKVKHEARICWLQSTKGIGISSQERDTIKDDADNFDQAATSFGDMNTSVAVRIQFIHLKKNDCAAHANSKGETH